MTPWCPVSKLKWYTVIILLAQVSGIANSVVSFSGVVTSLNNKKFNNVTLQFLSCQYSMGDCSVEWWVLPDVYGTTQVLPL